MKLQVNEKRKLFKVDPMIYGQFIEHFHRQIYGGLFEPGHPMADEDGFRTDVLEALRKIKVPILRWPGGCFVSAYHWKDGVGKDRSPSYDKAWRVSEPNTFGTDEYVRLCQKIGCEPYICTNAGTGTPEEMSDWVEYCNLPDGGKNADLRRQNGYEQPHRVRYWSIGNENYGDWEIGAKTSKEWSRFVTESAKMIKRTDPTIELSAAALTDMDWNMELLKSCGDRLSWISLHGYWDFHHGENQLADYEECMTWTVDLEAPVRKVRGLLTSLGLEKKIRIAYDEWNLRAWYHPHIMGLYQGLTPEEYLLPRDENDRNDQYNLADTVFCGCFLNMCIRNGDIVGMANFSPVVNTRGLIYADKDGIVLRGAYHVFDIYVNHMEEIAIDTWAERGSGCFTVETEKGAVEIEKLDVAATVNREGDRASIAIVNRHATEPDTLNISFVSTVKEYRLHEVTGAHTRVYNDKDRNEIQAVDSPWFAAEGNSLTIQVKPASVNVLQIRLA